MRSKNLETMINAFIKKIENESKKNAVKLAKIEVDMLKSKFAISTTRGYLTYYRKACSGIGYDLNSILRLKKSENNAIQAQYNKKVIKMQSSSIVLNNHNEIIRKAVNLLDDSNVYNAVCGLILLTGRRFTEIMKTAKFTSIRGKANEVYFEGQIKTKDAEQRKYIIPILSKYKLIRQAIKRVRAELKEKDNRNFENLTNEQISTKYNSIVNAKAFQAFKDLVGNISSHDLRKIYATICEHKYKPKNMRTAPYFSTILGHGKDDIATANSYMKYMIE